MKANCGCSHKKEKVDFLEQETLSKDYKTIKMLKYQVDCKYNYCKYKIF